MKKAGGNWVHGDQFFNRDQEVEELAERIRAGHHTLVAAPRRMGKTSLVRESLRQLEESGECATFFVDVEGAEDAADAVAAIAVECLSVKGVWSRVSETVLGALGQVGEVQFKDLKIKLRAGIDAGNWKARGDAVFQALADHEKPTVLAIDEFPLLVRRILSSGTDRITSEGRAAADVFLSWLRQNGQIHRETVTMILTGSVSLDPVLQQAKLSAHANIFPSLGLESWNEEVAADCLAALAEGYSIDLPVEVRQRMCSQLRCCVPHHVQQFFDYMHGYLQRSGRERATLNDVQTVYEQDMLGLRGQADLPHYESRLRLVLSTSDYQIAMAILTEAAINHGFIANQDLLRFKRYFADISESDQFVIEHVMSLLAHDGYLYKLESGYRYVSGLLEDWWRLRYGATYRPIAERIP